MKEIPNSFIAGQARLKILYVRNPRSAATPTAAMKATPRKSTSPSRIPWRSIGAGASGSGAMVVMRSWSRALDLLDLLERERLDLQRQRLEEQRLAVGLALRDGP